MTNKGKGKGKGKGKEVAGKAPAGKRKRGFDDDKTGGGRKRNNRGVLQFFEDTADVDESDGFSDFSDDDDDSDFGDDFFDEDFDAVPRTTNEPAKGQSSFPYVPKEELVDEEEFDRIMEERFRDPSRIIRFADEFDYDKVIDPSSIHAGANELIPTIWKVKCTVGRERLSAFCLMQKFADLNSLGTTLKIISAFAVDHMKGFVYIEADKQYDINEACQGIPGIYATRVAPVPNSEVHHLFSVRSRTPEISEGMWARIKGGNYKGDLAQVVAVNNTRKKVTVKLIPRVDLQALAAKFGGGYSRQKIAVPAPRLISSSELEEFRPLIQFKRDRDTGKVFEVLDGLMLKDGYVYKKVSPDSLSLWGVVPTEEELLKFGPSENNESNDLEWLSQLYGDKKKKRVIRPDKGGGKGESSSGSGVVNGFELYDLVCFGKKDFGVIVGMDKDDIYKILKESSDGPVAVTIERHEIKSGLFDLKLTALDQHRKTILVNDTVRVLEGPSKDKEGIVKHIYRGIVFLYDGNQEENGGYFTCKSNMCEKVKLAVGDCSGKDSEPGPLVFEDQPSSPRSPLSPKKPWQARENNREFNRGDNNNLFTIGQTLRIRIGPLKGYLCRVIALRRSDVTVKLDSQQKVLTVKCEHLSEVQGKSTAISASGDPDSSSSKPFDLLGTEGSSGGWMNGVGTSTGGGGWNAGGASSERDAWSNHSAPSFLKPESTSNPFSSKGAEDTAWETKSNSNHNSAWGAVVEKTGIASNPDQSGGWGNGGGSWGQAEHKTGSVGDDNQNSNWNNKPNNLDGNEPSGWDSKSNWNTTKASGKESSGWNNVHKSNETSTAWGDGNGFKSGSDEGNLKSTWSGWKSGASGVKVGNPAAASDIDGNQDAGWKNRPNKDGSESSGWETKNNWNALISSSHDKEEKGKDQGGWNAGKASNGSAAGFSLASGWKGGLSEEAREGSNWGNKKFGSSAGAENNGSDCGKASNWNSVSGDAGGNQGNDWGQRSNWNSGSGNDSIEKKSDGDSSIQWDQGGTKSGSDDGPKQASNWGTRKSGSENENQNSHWSSGNTEAGNQDSNLDKKRNWNSGNSGNLASDPKNSNWSSGSGNSNENSNWGNNGNCNSNKSSWGAGNENKNSNWSSGHTDPGNQDSNQGKKSNWNSGNSGNQASDPNNSNWNSGSGDSNQNSNWGNNSNWNSNKSSWSAGNENKNSNWSSAHTDPGNQDSNWDRKSNWNSGSGDTNQNGVNEGSNENSDGVGGGNWRGGYQGRGGFRGRGFRGRGERGGFGGRGERGGFGGRGRSDREGFGGRWGSDGGRGGRGRGRGRSDQSGGWNNRRDSAEEGSSDWKKGADNVEGWKNSDGSQAWNQDTGDKDRQSWSQGNADKEQPSWNQGGGSKQSWSSASGGGNDNSNSNGSSWNRGGGSKQSWSSASGGANDNWNSNESRQTVEASWKKSTTTEETNIQDGGWNKGSSSNTTSRGWNNQETGWKGSGVSGNSSETGDRVLNWGQSGAADKGQSSSWKESADGKEEIMKTECATGSWGKRNDGGGKGGW